MRPASRMRGLASATMAVMLSGCATVGPNFKAPEPSTLKDGSGYAMAGDYETNGLRLEAVSRPAWWKSFGSTDLNGVMDLALAGNPTTAEAEASLARAMASSAATEGSQHLQGDLRANAQRERINSQQFGFSTFPGFPSFGSPTINLFSIGGTVSYDLDLFGGRKRSVEQGQAQTEAAKWRADAAYLSVSGNVAMHVMRIAAIRSQIIAIEAVIADDNRIIEISRLAQLKGGEAPSASLGPRAQRAEDLGGGPALVRDLAASRHQLALLVGKSPAEWSPPDFDISSLKIPAELPVSIPSSLVRHRPDIRAAEAELHAATAAVGVAVSNRYPNIRLSANLTQTTRTPEDLFGYSASGWNLMSGLSAPLFNGGTLKARQRAAEADARVAMARYQQTVLRAFVQVSDALAALGTDQRVMAAADEGVAIAQANLAEVRAAYRLGGASQLQVIEGERRMNRIRRAVAQAQGQQLVDLVSLYAATATDWREPQH